jgi:beta-lactamase class D
MGLNKSKMDDKKKELRKMLLSLLLAIFLIQPISYAQVNEQERSEWEGFFKDHDADGAIVIVDTRTSQEIIYVFNSQRANQRYSPASTYKIPHTLFALDSEVVKDEFQMFSWDGVERTFQQHNQDQNLRSAMRSSAIWVYELFAKEIGDERAQQYLEKIQYGNADISTEHGTYWVDGNLSISAFEQVNLLQKLYRNELPFRLEHQLLLKDILIVEADRNWILRAKTGWEGSYGWWVGWVEWPDGPVFFALNIDTPNRVKDLYKREAITREILQSIHALPSN